MVSTPKIIGLMSCGFLLCLGLSNPVKADNEVPAVEGKQADTSHARQPGGPRVGGQGGQPDIGPAIEGEKSGTPHMRQPGGPRVGGQGGQPAPAVKKGKKADTPHARQPGGPRVGGQGGQ